MKHHPSVCHRGLIWVASGLACVLQQGSSHGAPPSSGAQTYSGPLPYATHQATGNIPTQGVLKILYIPVCYMDETFAPISQADAQDAMRQAADYYAKQSFGQLTVVATVAPPVQLPQTKAWYEAKENALGAASYHTQMSDAKRVARSLGYETNDYHVTALRYNTGKNGGGGEAQNGRAWLYGNGGSTATHEFGHCLGMGHSKTWDWGVGAPGLVRNGYEIMGWDSLGFGHFCVWAKAQMGWISDEHMQRTTSSGTYRIHAHDTGTLDPRRRYALRVPKDAARDVIVEVRQQFDDESRFNQPWLKNGAMIGWCDLAGKSTEVLDTTPGSRYALTDGHLVLGRTWTDVAAGVHFTPVAVTFGEQKAVDLVVNFDRDMGANQNAPVLSVQASATTVTTNTPVTFTATASDADGDALAYYWTLGNDTVFSNQSSITHTFASPGRYALTCVVSDMKGKTAVKTVVVTVGTAADSTVTGRVTANGAPVPGVLVGAWKDATTGVGRSALTDAGGYYTLTGLSNATYSIRANLLGYAFADQSKNVSGNLTGVNFASTVPTTVAVKPQVAQTAEGSATKGVFRLTRTGPVTSALEVKVHPLQGTASKGVDYMLSPDLSSNSTLTIPAGQSSLDVMVTGLTDGKVEGAESVGLQLVCDADAEEFPYVVTQGGATITITDKDSQLPTVGIGIDRAMAEESGAGASFIVRRTGSLAALLTVGYSVSGNAVNGTDYVSLPGSVVIPAGASEAKIPLTPRQDPANEGNETVTVSLATSSTFLRDSGASSATITISDDDAQVVTVSVADAVAVESSGAANPGSFLVQRSGNVSAPLTLYYAMSGSALHGTDYARLPGSVTIPAGQTAALIPIVPIADGYGEGSETVVLQLASIGGTYRLTGSGSATLTIDDNPSDRPTVEVRVVEKRVGDGAAFEAGGGSNTAAVEFIVTGGTGAALTVNYSVNGSATNGVDYSSLPGTITIPAGSGIRRAEAVINPTNDSVLESMEDVVISLVPSSQYMSSSATSSAVVLVRDNEKPTVMVEGHWFRAMEKSTTKSVSFDPYSDALLERNGVSSFYISRMKSDGSLETSGNLVVKYSMGGTATNGTDYQFLNGSTTIPDGMSGVEVVVMPIQDTALEGTETIKLTLTSDTAYSVLAKPVTISIEDDETPSPKLRFKSASAEGFENGGNVSIPVELTGTPAQQVTVEYVVGVGSSETATGGGVDYTLTSGVLTFPAGVASTKNITLNIAEDDLVEGDESLVISLKDPNGAALVSPSDLVFTIHDNDSLWNNPPEFTSDLISDTATEDAAYTRHLALEAIDANPDDTLTFSLVSGPAWLSVNANGVLMGTPGNSDVGINTFTARVADADGASDTVTLQITVANVNDAPHFSGTLLTGLAAVEDEPLSGSITSMASDEDAGDMLSFAKTGGPAWLTVSANGTLGGTPTNVDVGTQQFSVSVSDASGATAFATLEISVSNGNDAPYFATNPVVKSGATGGVAYSASLAGAASDIDVGDTVTYTKLSGPAWLSIAPNGAMSGTPPSGSTSANVFAIRATDSGGLQADATLVVNVGGNLPANWAGQDIGSVGAPGSANVSGSNYSVTGSGAAVWGSADAFQFVSQSLTGDGEIRARIVSQQNTHEWAKAGVMIRQGLGANAMNALVALTPGNGIIFQARSATGGSTVQPASVAANAAPNNWVRLTKSGTTVTAYASANGTNWTEISSLQLNLGGESSVGLAVCSRMSSIAGTAVFDHVSVTPFPAPWQATAIGGVAVRTEAYDGNYSVTSAGLLAGTADSFSFVHQPLSGDGEIVAKVPVVQGGSANSRSGVMIRESLTSNSRYAFMGCDGLGKFLWQCRGLTDGSTDVTASATGTLPNVWVKLTRSGNALQGYRSTDGVNWVLVITANVPMGGELYVGLVNASGSTTASSTSSYSQVSITP